MGKVSIAHVIVFLVLISIVFFIAWAYIRFHFFPTESNTPVNTPSSQTSESEQASDGEGESEGEQLSDVEPPPQHPEPEPRPEPGPVYTWYDGIFELPVSGATGFAPIPLHVFTTLERGAEITMTLTAGQGFTIIEEQGDWWYIRIGDTDGFIRHEACFINLPDVIPSIRYDITNAYSSIMRSAGVEIPNITGQALYVAMEYNPRLGRVEFTVPILYLTAKRLATAQRAALTEGRTLIIYEAFRPRETQRIIVDNFRDLTNSNREVSDALGGWGISAFISTSVSNHQRGAAIDASLGQILSHEIISSGDFYIFRAVEVEEYAMPSPMHELSARSIIFTHHVDTSSPDAWRNAQLAGTATNGALILQKYLTDAGFTPIASEWWHFNDLASLRIIRQHRISGDFFTPINYSILPM